MPRFGVNLVLLIFAILLVCFFCECTDGNSNSGNDENTAVDDDDDDTSDDDDSADQGYYCDFMRERVAGGLVGYTGTAIGEDSGGTKYIVATKGSDLTIYSSEDGEQWSSEIIDYMAADPDMAIDKDDGIHISYLDTSNQRLKYATNKTGDWEIISLDDVGQIGEVEFGNSIAVSDSDQVFISYAQYAFSETTLFLFKGIDGNWNREKVQTWEYEYEEDEYIYILTDAALVIGSNNLPHLVYIYKDYSNDWAYGETWYAEKKEGKWKKNKISHYSFAVYLWDGMYPDLALDSENKPHISFILYDKGYGTQSSLRYANFFYSILFKISICYFPGYYGSNTAISIDSNDFAHISFVLDKLNLYHITNKSGSWEYSLVDTYSSESFEPDVDQKIDKNGVVNLSYYSHPDLKFADNSDGDFKNTTIDTGEEIRDSNSAVVDENNDMHLAYIGAAGKELAYSQKDGSGWTAEIVELGDKLNSPSIGIGKNGEAHIVFVDRSLRKLKYTTKQSGKWKVQDVEDDIGSYKQHSLALDNDNVPHIAYIARDNNSGIMCKFASLNNGEWIKENFDENCDEDPSLAYDSLNKPHVVYCKENCLYYATKKENEWKIKPIDIDTGIDYWDYYYNRVQFPTIFIDKNDKVYVSYFR